MMRKAGTRSGASSAWFCAFPTSWSAPACRNGQRQASTTDCGASSRPADKNRLSRILGRCLDRPGARHRGTALWPLDPERGVRPGWSDPAGLALKAALGTLFGLSLAVLAKMLLESRAHERDLEARVASRTAEIQKLSRAVEQAPSASSSPTQRRTSNTPSMPFSRSAATAARNRSTATRAYCSRARRHLKPMQRCGKR